MDGGRVADCHHHDTGWRLAVLRWRMPDEIDDIKPATRMLDERVRLLGPMSSRERRLAGLGLATILAWILLGHTVGLAVIAMVSAAALFLLRVVGWKTVQGYVTGAC